MSGQDNGWRPWGPELLLAAFLPLKIATLAWAHYQGEMTFLVIWILGAQGGTLALFAIAYWWAIDVRKREHTSRKWLWLMLLVYLSVDVVAPIWQKTHMGSIKAMEFQPVEAPRLPSKPR